MASARAAVGERKQPAARTPLSATVTAVIVVAGLYFGRDLLIPFTLALLLSFLMAPAVGALERLRLGRALAVFVVLVLAVSIAGATIWLGVQQFTGIVTSLPQYRSNIERKLQTLRHPAGPGIVSAVQQVAQLQKEVTANSLASSKQGNPAARKDKSQPSEITPVPVQIETPGNSFLSTLGPVSASVAHVFVAAAGVVILTLFILMKRDHLRNRLFSLFGQGHLVLMTTALDDAARRVSRYLLTQSLINGTFGTLLATGLYFIGVPYAVFWGVLAAMLRFLPYVGTFVAGACPFFLSLAVFDGWSRPLWTLGLYLAIEGLTMGLVEPWLYATRTGISSLAILLSAAFWTSIWGPIGLVVSTPLTVCLAVLGRHVPPLEFLYVLLGDEPVLEPAARYYQRLLALNDDDAADVIDDCLKEQSLLELFDTVLIPALGLAERDRHGGLLDEEHVAFVFQTTRELIDELAERRSERPEETPPAPPETGGPVVCVPARDEADEIAGLMLVRVLRDRGWNADLAPVAPQETAAIQREPPGLLVISALPPFAIMHARSLCRKMRKEHPHVKVVLAVWNSTAIADKIKDRISGMCSDVVVTSLREAEAQIESMSSHEANAMTTQ